MMDSGQQSGSQPRAGAYAQMFRITYEDTSFNEWEQALTALLQYEFKCPVQELNAPSVVTSDKTVSFDHIIIVIDLDYNLGALIL